MGKTKENSSQKLEKRREAKKMSMRRARQKIRNDPIRYAEEKAKDRERKRKSRPHIQDLSERNQRKLRKEWKERSKRYRQRKKAAKKDEEYKNNFLESITPPILEEPGPSVKEIKKKTLTQQERGKRISRKNRDRMRKRVKELENLVTSLKRSVNKYKKQVSRANQSHLTNNPQSPNAKVKNMLKKHSVPSTIKKKYFLPKF
ncbi:hypothetical protein ABEB36_014030 [Hypothenemus hampei]|uniref:Uncharacterized protein n=1 Tax=Hypothenemus hampei TaxID=57062 RepID=A0ABD1E411_HYPHA